MEEELVIKKGEFMRRRFINKKNSIVIDNYLTIVALEDDLRVSLSLSSCEYCIDGDGNWKHLKYGTETSSIDTGHTLSFRGNLSPYDDASGSKGIGTFTISKKCNIKGNCMSMLFGDDADSNYSLSGKDGAFYALFKKCANIVNVSENFLPATTLAGRCYYSMFRDCTSLTQAPELPATTLASSCYEYMFTNCASLTQAPSLPATALAYYCYGFMFSKCTSLTQAPALPATTLGYGCYYQMFYGCNKLNYIKAMFTTTPSSTYTSNWVEGVASTGTFIKNKNAIWNVTGVHGIPSGWTVVNAITFTIGGTEYQAEEGMTWEEWIDSDYNTIGATISGTTIMCSSIEGPAYIRTLDGYTVLASDIILHIGTYKIEGYHAGGMD
jgi:hypothetical protein